MTPEDRHTIMTHAFTVSGECGRAWEVPMRCVLNDYVRFRRDADGHSRAQVMVNLTADDVSSWFYDQYNWDDVERDGRLVRSPTAAEIKEALDLMRGGGSPSRGKLAPSAHEAARVNQKRLTRVAAKSAQHSVQDLASSPKPKPKI